MMPEGSNLQPCERFTVLESRQAHTLLRCDVCDHQEDVHPGSGRRVLSGGEVEELRRRRLIATFERTQEERRRIEPDVPSPNGNPPSAAGQASAQ
jgi:hypothetical protein